MSPIPRQPLLRKGGANNRHDRESWQLKERDCRKLLQACDAAWAASVPMTRFVTLAWELGGCDPKQCCKLTGQFITLARQWLHARGAAMPWAWVQENGTKYGAHAHALLHVPPELDQLFRPMPRRWAKHVLGGEYVAGVIKCESLNTRNTAFSNTEAYHAELGAKLHYMLKCAPVALESELGMIGWGMKPWGQSCRVYGKRAGVWQRRNRSSVSGLK